MRATLAIFLIASLVPTIATAEDESWEMWEQRQVLLAEIERAKRLGGYSAPWTAVRNIGNGTKTEADIAPAYGSLEDVPGGPGARVPAIQGEAGQ